MAHQVGMIYGNSTGTQSSIGKQLIPFHVIRPALIEDEKERYFTQMADTEFMPKHKGKKIVRERYYPVLDDRNVNDQGIDASGNSTNKKVTITITNPDGMIWYGVGIGDSDENALKAAKKSVINILRNLNVTTQTAVDTNYDAAKGEAANWDFVEGQAVFYGGNLWGSSKDIGTFTSKLPYISETGGAVNRIGFKRDSFEAEIHNFGFFRQYSQDSMDFDNDPDLDKHITREAIRAAREIIEGLVQVDLINAAQVVYYGGEAISNETITGEDGQTPSTLTYDLIHKVNNTLTNNRCPYDTTIIKGSRLIDTRTISKARYAYISSDLEKTLFKMKDYHNEKAFVPVREYTDAGNIAAGEIGAIENVRFISVPEMKKWEGKGGTVTTNGGYRETDGKYDIYPVLFVGSKSFNTIGYQTDGTSSKFEIINKKPRETASLDDPYGHQGFWSIQWWYGFMAVRPEWIALVKVVAEK